MKIVYLLTYPIYHDGWTVEAWLGIENQNRWIPGVLAEMGHEVEYWAGDDVAGTYRSEMEGFPDYPIRIFETEARGRGTKFHHSPDMVAYAQAHPADLYLLKGVDGGLGTHLIRRHLLPARLPFVYVTGGGHRGAYAGQAQCTIYETQQQAHLLQHPRWPWQRPVAADRLIAMPKSVDTQVFKPLAEETRYDVLTISRLDRRNKSFAELGALSACMRVAVVGGGPDENALRAAYPRIEWIGRRLNQEGPQWINRTRVFLHNALQERRPTRDFFPRVIAEALACGGVVAAFDDIIAPDVLPDGVGVRVPRAHVVSHVQALLADEKRRARLREEGRRHAVAHLGKRSSREAMETLLQRLSPLR